MDGFTISQKSTEGVMFIPWLGCEGWLRCLAETSPLSLCHNELLHEGE